MAEIQVVVVDKVATTQGSPVIVCGNSDYTITFDFDDEWSYYPVKTARYVYQQRGEIKHQDVAFQGNTAAVPVLADVREVYVGVFAGELHTSTPARIPCARSILCWEPTHDAPDPDVYRQLLQLLADIKNGVEVCIDIADLVGTGITAPAPAAYAREEIAEEVHDT